MEGWKPWQKQKKQAMGKSIKFRKFTKIKHELEEQDISGGYRTIRPPRNCENKDTCKRESLVSWHKQVGREDMKSSSLNNETSKP